MPLRIRKAHPRQADKHFVDEGRGDAIKRARRSVLIAIDTQHRQMHIPAPVSRALVTPRLSELDAVCAGGTLAGIGQALPAERELPTQEDGGPGDM